MDFLEKKMIPKEQIIIFDEAQRAWDTKKSTNHSPEES
ncbi:hypothetical protein bcere0017_22530 [Bacillus cereus Rock1-3]|nr:hypothetical protein bcere0017_22530 [Bacillus cereus Rock1-3]